MVYSIEETLGEFGFLKSLQCSVGDPRAPLLGECACVLLYCFNLRCLLWLLKFWCTILPVAWWSEPFSAASKIFIEWCSPACCSSSRRLRYSTMGLPMRSLSLFYRSLARDSSFAKGLFWPRNADLSLVSIPWNAMVTFVTLFFLLLSHAAPLILRGLPSRLSLCSLISPIRFI